MAVKVKRIRKPFVVLYGCWDSCCNCCGSPSWVLVLLWMKTPSCFFSLPLCVCCDGWLDFFSEFVRWVPLGFFFLVVLYWVCRGDLLVFSGFCFLLWVFPFLWDFWSFLPDGFFLEFIWGILWGFRVYFARKISVILGSLQGWKLKKNDVRGEGDEGRKGVR